ncbi:hypothetical protein [Agrobacterium sp. MCAB5]|uniref:hypothetical protein n=1 Tax=Agrobacterium sp. MCAB5 TaxID=3233042 RepID=UPI003F8DED09
MSDIADDNWSERDDRNAENAPDGFPPGLPAQIETIGRMMMGATKRFWNKSNPVYQTSGTGDDYVVTPEGKTIFIHLYEIIRVRVNRTSTTASPTFKFGDTNPRVIKKVGPAGVVALIPGDLLAGQDHSLWYDGTNYILSNPATVDSASVVGVLKTANNLSELSDTAEIARDNLGLGTAATSGIEDFATASQGDDAEQALLLALRSREVLLANRTYYVAPSGAGSDSNSGLDTGSAWSTIQHAYDFVCDRLDLNGFKVEIRLMDGVHTDGLIASSVALGIHDTDSVSITGNSGNHNAVILRVSGDHAIRTGGVDGSHSICQFTLKNFRLETIGAGNFDCLLNNGATVHFAGLVFGQCTGSHITTTHLGWTYADSGYSVAKGATNFHIGSQSNGITVIHNQTVTFEEPLAFTAFVSVTAGAQAYINNVTWVNKANVTGHRFYATLGGLVYSQYQPIDYVPGDGFWLLSGGGRYNTFDGQPERITKFGDESRASSTTLQNDSGLVFPVEPNRFYVARFVIKFFAPAAAGFSWRLNGPAVSWVRLDKTWRVPGTSVVSTEDSDNGSAYPAAKNIAGSANQTGILEIEARISNGANAGQVAFQWAQTTSSASATIVAVTSYIDWQLVG